MSDSDRIARDAAAEAYRRERIAHWNRVARAEGPARLFRNAYHRRLEEIYRFLVTPGRKVLEVGCGRGDLLAALEPSVGVGVDFSAERVRQAAERHPGLRFVEMDAHEISRLKERFDVIILSDLLNDLWDVQGVLEQVRRLCTPRTRLIINGYSRLWELPLRVAQRLGAATPMLPQNWLTAEDLGNLLDLSGFELITRSDEVLLPLDVPLVGPLANRFLVKMWPFRMAALTHVLVARPRPRGVSRRRKPIVSVVVPARNEAGNVPAIVARVPEMGAGTEIVFVEGHSSDDTYKAIEREIAAHPERCCKLLRQEGTGKGDAVRRGFAEATGDVLMILDADLTVPPEDLPRFYEALVSGKAEFVNGVRLVYPMERRAMRFFNQVGNKFFSLAFSWLLNRPVKDTLCGTKVLWKQDYLLISANRSYFGDFDPFGDFDLLFGAAKLGLKIVDLPIRYRERTYGTTNIQRWKHGWMLLKMVVFAARRLRFV